MAPARTHRALSRSAASRNSAAGIECLEGGATRPCLLDRRTRHRPTEAQAAPEAVAIGSDPAFQGQRRRRAQAEGADSASHRQVGAASTLWLASHLRQGEAGQPQWFRWLGGRQTHGSCQRYRRGRFFGGEAEMAVEASIFDGGEATAQAAFGTKSQRGNWRERTSNHQSKDDCGSLHRIPKTPRILTIAPDRLSIGCLQPRNLRRPGAKMRGLPAAQINTRRDCPFV